MKYPARPWRLAPHAWSLALVALAGAALAQEPPPTVIDSSAIVRSLKPPQLSKRGFEVEGKPAANAEASSGGGSGKINLDIRFGNDSDRLTQATQTQLAALGTALTSPDLAGAKFLIAGHTSATGSAEHNQKLSEARARSVRAYLIEHFKIAPTRIDATGYGSSQPLPDFPPAALQQRRVEIITRPNG